MGLLFLSRLLFSKQGKEKPFLIKHTNEKNVLEINLIWIVIKQKDKRKMIVKMKNVESSTINDLFYLHRVIVDTAMTATSHTIVKPINASKLDKVSK